MNELIAEMSACFVTTELRIPQSDDYLDNHTAYVASWLTKLESDPKSIFTASSQASKASDFVLAFSRSEQTAVETEELPF